MEIIDIVILVTLLIPALVGVMYGFLNIILSLVGWGAAFSLAAKFSSNFSPLLISYAFFGVFILCLVIFSALGYFVLKLMARAGLTAADRILGMVFGIGLGGAIVGVMVFLAGFTELTRADWWQASLIVSPFEHISEWGHQFLPENIASYHQYGSINDLDN